MSLSTSSGGNATGKATGADGGAGTATTDPPHPPPPRHRGAHRTPLNLAVCIGGVLGSLCVYGVLQERVMTLPYGDVAIAGEEEKEGEGGGEMFKCSIFLVLMNRLVTVCISALGMFLTTDPFKTTTPMQLYAAIALSNLVTTVRGGGPGLHRRQVAQSGLPATCRIVIVLGSGFRVKGSPRQNILKAPTWFQTSKC